MAHNRRYNSNSLRTKKYNAGYVDGNAVRKLQAAQPARMPQQPVRKHIETQEDRREEKLRRAGIRRTNRLNFFNTVAVTAVVGVIFTICFQYLNLQSSVKNNASEVSELQSQLTQLTSENDENELAINSSIDYNQIYNTAVNDLGMVYPDRSQVVKYDPGVSEYVKQYQNVPSDSK